MKPSGVRQDLEALFDRCVPRLLNVAYRMLWNRADAEEVIQEAFLRLHNRLARERVENAEAYLRRTVVNLSIDRLRKARPDWSLDQDMPGSEGGASPHEALADHSARRGDREMDEKQRFELIQKAIQELPPRERAAFNLREFEQLTYKEIAEALDATMPQVKTWLYRARQKLARQLEPLRAEEEGGRS